MRETSAERSIPAFHPTVVASGATVVDRTVVATRSIDISVVGCKLGTDTARAA
jgi:hypothetical protein